MHLKSLELMGFKSFGRKTVFDFQPGLTAVVGPNGSGKSNICDAIRWVLGEQSAKALRGNKMAEVIFAGSPLLRPAAFAQVKLILDNEDRMMPVEFSEVNIGRQLFRSGESNYYFNGARSLLSDIRETLMDTGIGKDGYSVIGQGDIDDIIFQKTQTRRALIEEAAGITKFKHRKTATLQKLDTTKGNITRLQDIIGEIENQLGPLAEQADKARRYQVLTSEIRTLEVDLILFDLSQYYSEHENLDSMRRGILAKLTEIASFLEEIGKKKTLAREHMQSLEEALKSRQQNARDISQKIEETRLKGSSLKEEAGSQEARRKAILEEIASIDQMLFGGEQEINDASNRLKEEEAGEIEVNGRIAEIDANLRKVQSELEAHLKEVSQDQDSSFQMAVQMTEKKNRISTSAQQIQILQRQFEKGVSDASSLSSQIDKLATEKTRSEKEIATMENEIAENSKTLAEDQSRLNRVEKDLRRTEEELNGAHDQIKIGHARRNLLEELKNRSDGGIYRGVREALALKETGLDGIFGMVGDLLTVPKGYELAFEIALGGSIQDIITRDADTAQKAIAVLKERKAGRATFLPLDLIQAPPRIDDPKTKGCLGVALDLIQFDAKFYAIMNHLLGRILIFDRLDQAIEYAKHNRNFNRIVTIDGDIVRSSGALTGGADGQKSLGLLSRKRELDDLEEKIRSLTSIEKKLSGQLTRLGTERNQLLTAIRQREDTVIRRRQSLEFFRRGLEKTNLDLNSRRSEFDNLENDRKDLESELKRLNQALVDAQTTLATIEEQNRELSQRIQALKGREEGINARLTSLRGLHADEKLNLAQISERKKAVKKEIESASKRRRESQERKDRAQSEVDKLEKSVAGIQRQLIDHQKALAELEQEKFKIEGSLDTLQNDCRACSREIESLDHAYQSRAKIEDSSRNKLSELDIKLAEVKTHIKNKESILSGEYGFDLTETGSSLRKYENREEIITRIATRKGEQEALQPVNPLAIEDYEKTKERHDFLITQINDLTEAATSLEQVISEIEKISCERFMQAYNQINMAFGDIFSILFPSGNAHLKLTTPDDPLNSNVEVICQLPGKKLSTIELFSGGEKALISIALLFSILQVKPPAFCILDEIEASLDEANVRRFTRLLRNFADKTQFIIITHNKETMQAVDVIYGITLEKSGISRQVSIRLEDHDKIREFSVKKPPIVTEGNFKPSINETERFQENYK